MSIPIEAEFVGVFTPVPTTSSHNNCIDEGSVTVQNVGLSIGEQEHVINTISYDGVESNMPKKTSRRVTEKAQAGDVPLPPVRFHTVSPSSPGISSSKVQDKESDTGSNSKSSIAADDLGKNIQVDRIAIQSTVQVVVVGAPQSGKTSLVESLPWGMGTCRSEKGRTPIHSRNFKDDGRRYNVVDLSCKRQLDVLPNFFLSSKSLIIIVWNMGANNPNTFYVRESSDTPAEFKNKKRKAIRALDRDIDDNVQFWIDNVQSNAQGASILLVATFDDQFDDTEASRRCAALKKRLEKNDNMRSKASPSYQKPSFYPCKEKPVMRVSNTRKMGMNSFMEDIVKLSDKIRNGIGRMLWESCLESYGNRFGNDIQRLTNIDEARKNGVSDLCAFNEKNEYEEKYAKTAASFLSELGHARYYGNHSRSHNKKDGILDNHIVFNHVLLIEAAKSILQHENFVMLQNEIEEAKIDLGEDELRKGLSALADHRTSCQIPIVSPQEASLLWRCSDVLSEHSNKQNLNIPAFFQAVMVRYGAFIPVHCKGSYEPLYLLPSLLENNDPRNTWTYKCGESWKTSLCYSWLFSDAVPSNFMEEVIKSVTQDMMPFINNDDRSNHSHPRVREILCSKTSIYLKLGSKIEMKRESIMEILITLADKDSPLCVASSTMLIGTRRLIASAKGSGGAQGRMIWKGGFKLIIDCIDRVLKQFPCLKDDKEIVCPECLASQKPASDASVWKWDAVNDAANRDQEELRCRNAHPVKIPLISGMLKDNQQLYDFTPSSYETCTPVSKLLGGVVLVGLLDKTTGRIIRAGSGFVIDTIRGLIVTASHTLIDMDNHMPDGQPNSNFGDWYYGLEDSEVIIGVIPQTEDGESKTAVYRYFAKILMADVRNVDACVLWITKKLEKDLDIDGEIGDDHAVEDIRYKPQGYFEKEGLTKLSTTSSCEYEERVRILGYNQGGEGLLGRELHVNRTADFSVGIVCKKFQCPKGEKDDKDEYFRPREEIVVIRCPTIGGHSGGPCVNQVGKVIGILSRTDPAEAHRCYIAPSSEWSELVCMAKGRVKFVRRLQNIL